MSIKNQWGGGDRSTTVIDPHCNYGAKGIILSYSYNRIVSIDYLESTRGGGGIYSDDVKNFIKGTLTKCINTINRFNLISTTAIDAVLWNDTYFTAFVVQRRYRYNSTYQEKNRKNTAV